MLVPSPGKYLAILFEITESETERERERAESARASERKNKLMIYAYSYKQEAMLVSLLHHHGTLSDKGFLQFK